MASYVREVGRMTDPGGSPVVVGVDFDSVTIYVPHVIRFESLQADEFAQLYNRACREAGRQSALMAEELTP